MSATGGEPGDRLPATAWDVASTIVDAVDDYLAEWEDGWTEPRLGVTSGLTGDEEMVEFEYADETGRRFTVTVSPAEEEA